MEKLDLPGPAIMSRREAVKLAAVGLAGVSAGAGSTAVLARLARTAPPQYRFFTETEAALLIDITEQIIPGDDAPGATDAGVIHYIDRQVSSGFLVDCQEAYRRGLASFRQTCHQEFQCAFADLSATQKLKALRLIEAGQADPALWHGQSQLAFFRLVVDHTMQGFYGSPRHGGNRDYVSYRMLGVDYPQIIGQNQYKRIPRGTSTR